MAGNTDVALRREHRRRQRREMVRRFRERADEARGNGSAPGSVLCSICRRRPAVELVTRINPQTWKREQRPYCGRC